MKFLIFLLFMQTAVLAYPLQWKYSKTPPRDYAYNIQPLPTSERPAAQYIRVINNSSLRQLPGVLNDVLEVLNKPWFKGQTLFGKDGFTIHLYDITCSSFENAARVRYQPRDTLFELKLNRFNAKASDRALAATIIHETIHCILLDIYNRAQKQEPEALATIMRLGLTTNDSSNIFSNDFFMLMNSGEVGQHELMQQHFYPYMVSLLEQFTEKHGSGPMNKVSAERLMWTGLMTTGAYKKLSTGKQKQVESELLEAKGMADEIE